MVRRGFSKSSAGPFVFELERGKRGQLSRQRARRDSGGAGQPYLARAGAPREVAVDGTHSPLGRFGGRPRTAIGAGAAGRLQYTCAHGSKGLVVAAGDAI